ncbi:Na+-driven multidrug efflux pump [Elusimicrobium minutum Pei191]|uniref:Multidrug-efflux transporter n=1 Tax=Elusimicrobium minutum (strain Pei191) TaxID=445932 RepID=B2KCC9_ELUMP|nr:MATE family efflux transporter [Elusimicrobium minutum]ACC98050.1 Na+-driven multidrug efflux pump [Elusimicrobium minutum Pei191]
MGNAKKSKSLIKEIWLVAYPLIITNASIVTMQFVDRIFLSRYSPDALAACVPGGSLAFTFVALFMGIAAYTGVFVAQYDGQKKRANISVSLWQGIIISLFSGIIIALLTPVGFWVIDLFDHAPEVVVLEKQYFGILNLFGGVIILTNALSAFFIGRGKTTVPMSVTIIGNIINMFFAYAMIFGHFGFPEMGIKGAGVAYIIGNAGMVFCYILFIFNHKNERKYRIAKLAGFNKLAFMRLVRYGVPNGFGFFTDILSFTIFTFFVGHLDMFSLAAHNIAISMQTLSFMPILGLGLGVQIVVGRYMGMKKPDKVVEVVKNACKMGLAYAGTLAALFILVPNIFIGLFLQTGAEGTAEITKLALPLIKIVSFFVFADCIYLIFGDTLRGAGDTKFHMVAMLASGWLILVPGTYIFVYILKKDVLFIWGWLTFYAVVTAVLMTVRFFMGRWRTIDITAK